MKTLEHLLLDTLSEPESYTVHELSALWGEDRVRVHDWVTKFVKRGLVRLTGNVYKGDPVKISEYLRTT